MVRVADNLAILSFLIDLIRREFRKKKPEIQRHITAPPGQFKALQTFNFYFHNVYSFKSKSWTDNNAAVKLF